MAKDPITGLETDGQAVTSFNATQQQNTQPGQNVQLNTNGSPTATAGTNTGTPLNTASQNIAQIGQQATNVALQGPSPQTAGLVSQQTQNMLQNPTFDPQKFKTAASDIDAQQRAQAMEQARRQTAGLANTGARQRQLQDLAFQSAQQRGQTLTDIDLQAQQEQRRQLMENLAEGRATAETESNLFTTGLQGLQTAGSVVDPSAAREFASEENALDRAQALLLQSNDIEGQQALATLQGQIEEGLLLSAQDFEGVQSSLDRELELAVQNNDINAQIGLLNLQAELNEQAAEADRQFSTAERIATQAWQTGERIDEQSFTRATQVLDQRFQEALQANDIDAQALIERDRNNLALAMQTNDMTHDEKMANLSAELETAFANDDVERQQQLLTFQAGIQFEEDMRNFGFEQALAAQQGVIDQMLDEGRFENAETLQRELLFHQAEEAAADRQLQEVELQLRERGLEMEETLAQWNTIQDGIDNGTIDPDAGFQFLQNTLEDTGIELTRFDADAALLSALEAEDRIARQQFLLTNPQYRVEETYYVDAEGNEIPPEQADFANQARTRVVISDEGNMAYNDFFNSSVMGDSNDTINSVIDGTITGAQLANDPDARNEALASAPQWTPSVGVNDGGFWGADYYEINNVPTGPFKLTDRLYVPTSGITVNTSGDNYTYFTAVDAQTGDTIKIKTGLTSDTDGGSYIDIGGDRIGVN